MTTHSDFQKAYEEIQFLTSFHEKSFWLVPKKDGSWVTQMQSLRPAPREIEEHRAAILYGLRDHRLTEIDRVEHVTPESTAPKSPVQGSTGEPKKLKALQWRHRKKDDFYESFLPGSKEPGIGDGQFLRLFVVGNGLYSTHIHLVLEDDEGKEHTLTNAAFYKLMSRDRHGSGKAKVFELSEAKRFVTARRRAGEWEALLSAIKTPGPKLFLM